MNDYLPGEIIDVTISGARIESISDVGIAQCSLPNHAWRPTINLRADGVEVERRAPAEWPPRHGDLWRDRSGGLWAGAEIHLEDGPYVMLFPLSSSRSSADPDRVLQDCGPVALAHREPEADAEQNQEGGLS